MLPIVNIYPDDNALTHFHPLYIASQPIGISEYILNEQSTDKSFIMSASSNTTR